ncbi:hypothetical protein HTT03_07715 [Sulfitobacter sp. S0837]|uniref:hypothetical protein n=1 Tax=Sulfitobacter maritimus TaxID=2741719 RepID=UPI00158390D2|nr:hypothetical protein [Sulfitobacter maritimus]NUH65178.1 hypothetical protein [Sulfitobacter maritimus]
MAQAKKANRSEGLLTDETEIVVYHRTPQAPNIIYPIYRNLRRFIAVSSREKGKLHPLSPQGEELGKLLG